MASSWYDAGRSEVLNGGIVLLTDTIKVVLLSPSYTFSTGHQFISDVVANELSGTGYAGGFAGAGRKALASKTIVKDTVGHTAYFDAADLTWTAINAGTIGWAILVKEITNDASSKLIAVLDPSDFTTVGADVTLQFAANGLLVLT